MLPTSLVEPLQDHLARQTTARQDLDDGYGAVYLPTAFDRKYPNAASDWSWQYVFPSIGCPPIRGQA